MTDAPPIALRPATTADAERIAALFTDEGYPAGPSASSNGSSASARRIRGSSWPSTTARSGFIAIHALPRFEHDDRIVRVLALVVDAGVRERGVGHLLMAEAENVGRELGAAFTEVTAGHHRPDAQRLYESLGYDATVTTYLRKKL